jgi:integrase
MPQSTKVTRRGHHEGTIRKRPDGRWEARLTLPNGRRKSLYGQTRRDVQDKIRSARRDADQGLDLSARSQTVGQFLDRWLADVVRPTTAPKTAQSYADVVRVHLVPALGSVQLAQLTAQHVQRLLQDKLASGLSPRTVAYIRTVLRIALNRGLKWGLVTRNVAALTDPPRVTRTERTPLTPDQARSGPPVPRGRRRKP